MIYRHFILILYLFGHLTFAQNKEGYIQYDKVIQNVPEYIYELEKIELLKSKFEDSLKTFVQEFSKRINIHSTGNIDLTYNEIKEREEEIIKIENKIEDFRNQSLYTIEVENKKIKAMVISKLKEYCLKNNISCIVDKNSILYCSNCTDYTNSFIAFTQKK